MILQRLWIQAFLRQRSQDVGVETNTQTDRQTDRQIVPGKEADISGRYEDRSVESDGSGASLASRLGQMDRQRAEEASWKVPRCVVHRDLWIGA